MRAFRISPTAARDLKSISTYTIRYWGRAQHRLYIAELKQRMEWLSKHPKIGKHRSDVRNGVYCYPQGEHLIFYSIYPDWIDIIAVIHHQMDIPSHLT